MIRNTYLPICLRPSQYWAKTLISYDLISFLPTRMCHHVPKIKINICWHYFYYLSPIMHLTCYCIFHSLVCSFNNVLLIKRRLFKIPLHRLAIRNFLLKLQVDISSMWSTTRCQWLLQKRLTFTGSCDSCVSAYKTLGHTQAQIRNKIYAHKHYL